MTKIAIVALYTLVLLGMYRAGDPPRPVAEVGADEGELAKRSPAVPGRFVAGEAVKP